MGGRGKLADSYWQRTSSISILRGSFHFPPSVDARTWAEHPRDPHAKLSPEKRRSRGCEWIRNGFNEYPDSAMIRERMCNKSV